MLRTLRITGLPPEMAIDSVRALLRAERCVRAIDVLEGASGDPASSTVFVVVESDGIARIHRKITTGFAGIDVEDVTRLGASAYVPLNVAAIPRTPPTAAPRAARAGDDSAASRPSRRSDRSK